MHGISLHGLLRITKVENKDNDCSKSFENKDFPNKYRILKTIDAGKSY